MAADSEIAKRAQREFTKATLGQKIGTAILLIFLSGILAWLCAWVIYRVADSQKVIVKWQNATKLRLKPGPAAFCYKEKAHELAWSGGPIDDKTKQDLLKLAPEEPEKGVAEFQRAICELVLHANERTVVSLLWLLLLGGLGGVVGVLIRAIGLFVWISTEKDELDVNRYWPWYVMRPVLGFLNGALVVVLVKSNMLDVSKSASSNSLWWLGISVLAGYSLSEFMNLLAQVTKLVLGPGSLGSSSQDSKDKSGGGAEPAEQGAASAAPAPAALPPAVGPTTGGRQRGRKNGP